MKYMNITPNKGHLSDTKLSQDVKPSGLSTGQICFIEEILQHMIFCGNVELAFFYIAP